MVNKLVYIDVAYRNMETNRRFSIDFDDSINFALLEFTARPITLDSESIAVKPLGKLN